MHNSHAENFKAHFSTIVVIGFVWPEPNSSAAGSRMLQLLCFFKQRANKIVFASPALFTDHKENLAALGIIEKKIQLNCESFDLWIKQLQPDLVLFDRFVMEEQFGWRVEQQCPDCITILDTEDLHSLRAARQQQLKNVVAKGLEYDATCTDLATLFDKMSPLDICQREIASIYRCDLSLMISSFEITLLTTLFAIPHQLLLHLPFMLDLDPKLQCKTSAFEQRSHFVTIGNFRHPPNWDSPLWLKNTVWPKVREQLPTAQLHIYGAYPAKKVTALHNPKQGFYIKGWAQDAFNALSEAKVCLSPLRFGAGIKGKFTDAMLARTPSVTTPIGSEAMHGELPWPGQIENNSQDIANAAVRLYKSQETWQQASDRADRVLQTHYNKILLTARLDTALNMLRLTLNVRRRQNFTGAMLRHHQHKSTKYMAQWIAEKNKH